MPPALRGDIGYAPPESWSSDRLELRQLPSGDWLAAQPELPSEGILLKSDGAWFPFFGALGKAVPLLGLPASREYFLASTKLGRYQVYERGLAVWETFRKGGEIGYPVVTWESVGQRARTCRALIAFFDLRNFTKWSDSPEVDANGIQDVIEKMEHSFQEAFSRPWCQSLFAKGTGDGFMVVSEAGWHAVGGGATETSFQAGHTKAFCRACAETVQRARKIIPEELAIGCGITTGQVTQLYLLGRVDYIGPPVNEASKIQAIAYNELCMSAKVVGYLLKDGTYRASYSRERARE